MPNQSPAPIHIRIDIQEQRSGIPDLLAAMPQVHIEVIPLRMGDYDVGGDPCRVFERKTASDFHISLAEGRLFAQLAELRKSRFAPLLLLEGDPLRVERSQMRPRASAGRSPTSLRSCACRSCPAADRKDPHTWSMPPRSSASSASGSPICGFRPRCRAAQGFSARTADADRALPAGCWQSHSARGMRTVWQPARPAECRRRYTGDDPRGRACACRRSRTAAARLPAVV